MSENAFSQSSYPAPFLERFDVIECLFASSEGETLLVIERGSDAYCVAKVTQDDEPHEVAWLRQLSHPALPKIVAVYEQDGAHVLVREYFKGKPLDVAAAERPFSRDEVVHIGVQLCDVLAYLHAQTPPVIHRDVKPGNVILSADGAVSLIDFGIARTYKPGVPKDTVFSGTNDFAPPEQYGYAQTDARADIYALGMLLKFLLTKGDMNAKIMDGQLRRVVGRCTAFAPSQRYKNALSVRRALLSTQKKTRSRVCMAAALMVALCVGALAGRYAFPYFPVAEVSFIEPVIEQAVRLTLNKPAGALTTDDLSRVRELYIFQDTPYKDMAEYHDVLMAWYASGRAAQNGNIKTLADLYMLPNLTTLVMTSEPITDLSPLAACPALEAVEFSDLQASDFSVFAELPKLRRLRLVGMVILDIRPLEKIDRLTILDLTSGRSVYDPAPLANMGDFAELSVIGSATTHQYLSGKRIGWLGLSNSGISDMASLSGVAGLWYLELNNTAISNLSGIEEHKSLSTLNIAHTPVTDLSPLLALQNLTELVLSEDMQVDTSVLSGMENLTIRYE